MDVSVEQVLGWLGQYAWVFLRLTGVFLVAPVFAAAVVPTRVKLVLAMSLAVALAPGLPPVEGIDPFSADGLLTAAAQLLIGFAIGFIAQSVFDALVLAGQVIANTMGLGFATMIDPSRGVTTPVVSQIYLIMGLLLYLSLNGHLVLLATVADSFRWLPVGAQALTDAGLAQVVSWGGQIFAAGVVVALPATAALLVVNLAMGVVSRAAPQLNLFAVGFPVSMLFGFLVLVIGLPALDDAFRGLLEQAFQKISLALGAGGRAG